MADYILTSEDRRKLEEALHIGLTSLTNAAVEGPHDECVKRLREADRIDAALALLAALAPVQEDAKRLDFLEAVTHQGYCPGIVFDDDGHWAVLFDGMQSAPGQGPPFATSFMAGKEAQWHDTVRAAIDAAMKVHPQP